MFHLITFHCQREIKTNSSVINKSQSNSKAFTKREIIQSQESKLKRIQNKRIDKFNKVDTRDKGDNQMTVIEKNMHRKNHKCI